MKLANRTKYRIQIGDYVSSCGGHIRKVDYINGDDMTTAPLFDQDPHKFSYGCSVYHCGVVICSRKDRKVINKFIHTKEFDKAINYMGSKVGKSSKEFFLDMKGNERVRDVFVQMDTWYAVKERLNAIRNRIKHPKFKYKDKTFQHMLYTEAQMIEWGFRD